MKKFLVFTFLVCQLTNISAQNFTWIKGTSILNQNGTYGTLGLSATANNPGGREYSATWKDAAGNFWLFGGLGLDKNGNEDFLNDLWKYNPGTNEWTWIKGDSLIAVGGSYGTLGVPSPSNMPGSRAASSVWQDANGNVWIFGGYGYDASSSDGELNDLWKYDPSSNQWTWMGGSSFVLQSGFYGSIGVSSSNNQPGARFGAAFWQDASGNFYLFGGSGYDNGNIAGLLSDLWKYNTGTNQWTWIKGNNTIDQQGTYGTQGVAATNNLPGGRSFGNMLVDQTGNFWLFGGDGFASTTTDDFLNDLWKYNSGTNEWTWMKGSNLVNQIGKYGTMGVASTSNTPGARLRPNMWLDQNNDLILFSGLGNALNSVYPGDLNDMWKYNFSTNNWTWIKGNSAVNARGNYGTVNVMAATNKIGARYDALYWQDASNNVWIFGGMGYVASGTTDGYLNDLWKISPCIQQSVSITASSNQICIGESATLTANGSTNYLWSNSLTSNSIVVSPTINTSYTLSNADGLSCGNSSAFNLVVDICAGLHNSNNQTLKSHLYPNPNNGGFTIVNEITNAQLIIYNTVGQKVFEQQLTNTNTKVTTPLSQGVYYYSILQNSQVIGFGKLMVE